MVAEAVARDSAAAGGDIDRAWVKSHQDRSIDVRHQGNCRADVVATEAHYVPTYDLTGLAYLPGERGAIAEDGDGRFWGNLSTLLTERVYAANIHISRGALDGKCRLTISQWSFCAQREEWFVRAAHCSRPPTDSSSPPAALTADHRVPIYQ
jgi:hypothetical protein